MASTSNPKVKPLPAQSGKNDTNMLQRTSKNMLPFPKLHETKNQVPPAEPKSRLPALREDIRASVSSTKTPLSLYPRPPKRALPDTAAGKDRKRSRVNPPTSSSHRTNHDEPAKLGHGLGKEKGANAGVRPPPKTEAFDQLFRKANTEGRKGQKGRKERKERKLVNSRTEDKLMLSSLLNEYRIMTEVEAEPVANPIRAPSPPPEGSPFFRLPRELRDKIYSYLLQASTPINVHKAWTQCYSRYRAGLDPGILVANKQAAAEGTQVLYSTNTFVYLLRDDGHPIPQATDPAGLAAADTKPPPPRSRVIFLAKHAPLIRRLELFVESNRTNMDYCFAIARALDSLSAMGVRPLELAFKLAPRLECRVDLFFYRGWSVTDFFSAGLTVMPALRKVHFERLRFSVYTPQGRRLETVMDGAAIRAAPGGGGSGEEEEQGEDQNGGEIWDPWA